ncbi:MAG: tetratricopeptide repeat protein [Armatimonadetes bacterium]|nr:tetratricopeptide repeat protein [Armatimonadota bacterium]
MRQSARYRIVLRCLSFVALVLMTLAVRPGDCAPANQNIVQLQAQAQQLMQKKQYSKALDVLKKITSLQPGDQRSWFNLGIVSYEAKNLDGARWGLSRAYKLNSTNDIGKRSLGILESLLQSAAQQGDVAQAKKMAETVEAINPRNASVPFALGLLSTRKKEFNEAAHQFSRSVELNPKNFDAWMNLGFARANAKDYGAAIEAYNKAAALKPSDPRPQAMIAQTALQANDLKAAEKGFKSVVASQPTNVLARLQYAQVLEKLNKSQDALVQYQKAATLEPGNFIAQMNLGRLEYGARNFKAAEKAYEAAVKADPKSSLALGNLGLVKSLTGKNSEAEALYKKALAADPRNANAYEGLAYVYEVQNKTPEAVTALEKGRAKIADKQQRAAMTERLAGLYERQGKQDQALRLWEERAAETHSAESYRAIARVQSSRNKLSEAAEAYEQAAKASKDSQPLSDYLSAAQMWSRADQPDKAIADTDLAKKAEPKKLEPYFTAAIILSDEAVKSAPDKDPAKADFTKALAEYDAALKIDGSSTQALIGKAAIYERQQKYDEAIAQYRKVEEVAGDEPNAPQILSKLGLLLTEASKPDEALAEYKRLAEKYPKDAALQVNLADALNKKGDYDAAVKAYEEAYTRNPKVTAPLSKAAEVLSKQGKKDEARDMYLRLAEIDPTGSDALPKLKDIYSAEGKTDDYRQLLRRLVMSQPKSGPPPYDQFLEEYAKAGLTSDAVQTFQQLAAKQPAPDILTYEGKALRMAGKPKESVQTLSKALKAQPDNPMIHKELALSYLDLNNTERATAHLQRVVNAPFSFDFDARDRLAELYEKQGKKKEARALYEQTLQMNPADEKARQAIDRIDGKPVAQSKPVGPTKADDPGQPGQAVHSGALPEPEKPAQEAGASATSESDPSRSKSEKASLTPVTAPSTETTSPKSSGP